MRLKIGKKNQDQPVTTQILLVFIKQESKFMHIILFLNVDNCDNNLGILSLSRQRTNQLLYK